MKNDLEQAIEKWRGDWVAKMMNHSRHPDTFWHTVADRLIADRRKLGNDPLIPLGLSAPGASDTFQVMALRNQEALNLEVKGNLDEAVLLFESNVADCFGSQSPYDRLRIIYTARLWYEDALRVCTEYVAQSERPGMGNQEYFRMHAERLSKKLRRQRKQGGVVKGVA